MKNRSFNQDNGFTLIELVVVIVILGILAVTAAPKFVDLTGDAKASVVQATEGALNSAADMAHAKAIINGVTNGALSIAGENITFANTYPDANSINLLMDIDTSASDGDFILTVVADDSATYSHAKATTPAECIAIYQETSDSHIKPQISSLTTGC